MFGTPCLTEQEMRRSAAPAETLAAFSAAMTHAPCAMILTDVTGQAHAWNLSAARVLPDLTSGAAFLQELRPWLKEVSVAEEALIRHAPETGGVAGFAAWPVTGQRPGEVPLVMLQALPDAAMTQRLADMEHRHQRLQQEACRLRHLAECDRLTGLLNAQAFSERCSAMVTEGQHGVLLYLDLDGFKPVNDTHGHAIGDRVLREVADRLSGLVRQRDLVARLGGDEFAIWLSGNHSTELDPFVSRLRAELRNPVPCAGEDGEGAWTVSVGCSIGVARSNGMTTEFAGLLALADAAMYSDKRGRGQRRDAAL